MSIQTIYAHLSCSDLASSTAWYEKLSGKSATRNPMPGLAEWQFTDSAAVQLFEDRKHAGTSTLTIGITELEAERKRLEGAGLAPGEIEEATKFSLVRLRDPDGNLVVLAGEKRG
jgi:catechol 2,3-dioxygenase-like lactoylglutathione lyase family enzyme